MLIQLFYCDLKATDMDIQAWWHMCALSMSGGPSNPRKPIIKSHMNTLKTQTRNRNGKSGLILIQVNYILRSCPHQRPPTHHLRGRHHRIPPKQSEHPLRSRGPHCSARFHRKGWSLRGGSSWGKYWSKNRKQSVIQKIKSRPWPDHD